MASSEAEESKARVVGGKAAASRSSVGAAHIDERALQDMHFVGLVRSYEQLYMRDHPLYGDHRRRNAAWEEIATIVEQPAEVCRKRWARMRANYYRFLERARERGTKELEHRPSRPAHEKMMTFLDQPFLASRELCNKMAKTVHKSDKEESENEYIDHSSDDHNSRSEAAAELQDSSDDDDVVDFFVELGESVKDLPEAVRIHVKREAFRIVTDAEEMLYHRKLGTDPQMYTSEYMSKPNNANANTSE